MLTRNIGLLRSRGIFILLGCLLQACSPDCPVEKVKKLLGDDYGRRLIFSDQLHLENTGKALARYCDDLNAPKSKYRIIHYFDADCSTCVDELVKIQAILAEREITSNLRYIFIGSSSAEENFRYVLKTADLQVPVYFEKGYKKFKKENKLPLTDNIYNTILINNRGEILLFGSFFHNEKAYKLALDLIKCI